MLMSRGRKKGSEIREVVLQACVNQPRHISEIQELIEAAHPGRWDRQQLRSVLGDLRRSLYLGRTEDGYRYRITPFGKQYLKEIAGSL